jgi:hypothetical protein
MYYYTPSELGLDYSDFIDDKYSSEDYFSENEEYEHEYLNDDNYELPF